VVVCAVNPNQSLVCIPCEQGKMQGLFAFRHPRSRRRRAGADRPHGTLVSLRQAMSLDDDFAIDVEDTLPSLGALDLAGLRAANENAKTHTGLRAA